MFRLYKMAILALGAVTASTAFFACAANNNQTEFIVKQNLLRKSTIYTRTLSITSAMTAVFQLQDIWEKKAL